MKTLLGLLIAPLCLFAMGSHPISSPVDFLGNNLPLVDGLELSDSTWVVADSELTLWFSRDHGEYWESLPLDSAGEPGEIAGPAVVSSDRLSIWTFSKGWTPMRLPASYVSAEGSYFGPRGDRGYLDETLGRIRYYRSTDRMTSWSDWFSMDISLVPSGSSIYGDMEVGRIWYMVADSGSIRGTSNGTTWTKSVLPADFEPFQFEPEEADTVLQLIGQIGQDPVLARSGNLGATWRILPLTAPGGNVRRLTSGVWSSSTTTNLESAPERWLSRTPWGPWTKLDVAGVNAIFAVAGGVLLATATGLEQVDLSFSSSTSGKTTLAPEIRRLSPSLLEIQAGKDMSGTRWQIVGIDGSTLGSGRLHTGLNQIPCPTRTAWIRLGTSARAIPPR